MTCSVPRQGSSSGTFLRTAAWSLLLSMVAGCASLPSPVEPAPSRAFDDTAATALGRALAPMVAAHPGLTGILPLNEGREAFAARHQLAAAAQRSIDIQTYIWRADTSGKLIAHALWLAAERGVRVRILLDDANTRGLDEVLLALDAHPRIEVRLFNPFANRSIRLLDAAGDFARVNRRMHNKTFIVDNQVAIVGGRNIGDEYLGATQGVEFADLDVIAAGAAVAVVSASFDDYWNSAPAYPVAAMVRADPGAATRLAPARWAAVEDSPEARTYIEAVRTSVSVPRMLADGFEWTSARFIADEPGKVFDPPDRKEMLLLPRLQAALGVPQRQLLLVSPYFVPTRQGTEALVATAARGVQVSVLTNSLAATDVAPAYAGYARYRHALLRGGVRLYELKPSAAVSADRHRGGSSGASLHAKTFAVDGERLFVGSFNLDPRSARLNTESGLVIDSPRLATRLGEFFETQVPQGAYEVRLGDGAEGLVWIERDGATETRHAGTPHAGALRLAWITFLGWLPIEWLL